MSFIVERFKWGESGCLPACQSYNFHLEFLHVSLFAFKISTYDLKIYLSM